jgi:hypothetical protein
MHIRHAPTTAALAGFALFILSVLAMPLLEPAYDPVHQTISEGALGRDGAIQIAGFFALATGSFALAWCLCAMHPPGSILLTAALIGFSGACVVALAVFPTDASGETRTWTGQAHSAAATFAFISNVAAMLWSARAFHDDGRLAPFARLSLAVGVATLAMLILLRADVEPRGLIQRSAVAGIQLWLVAVSLRLRAASPTWRGRQQRRTAHD